MTMVVTNYDLGGVALFDTTHQPNTLVLSAAVIAVGYVTAGLILARNTVTGKMEDYVIGGPNGTGTPTAVVGAQVELPAGALAGDEIQVNPIIGGKIRREKLLTSAADVISNVIVDALRDYGIVALNVTDVSKLDNQ